MFRIGVIGPVERLSRFSVNSVPDPKPRIELFEIRHDVQPDFGVVLTGIPSGTPRASAKKNARLEPLIIELVAGIAPLSPGRGRILSSGKIGVYDRTNVRAFHSEPALID